MRGNAVSREAEATLSGLEDSKDTANQTKESNNINTIEMLHQDYCIKTMIHTLRFDPALRNQCRSPARKERATRTAVRSMWKRLTEL
jgi:hypothetical protein